MEMWRMYGQKDGRTCGEQYASGSCRGIQIVILEEDQDFESQNLSLMSYIELQKKDYLTSKSFRTGASQSHITFCKYPLVCTACKVCFVIDSLTDYCVDNWLFV